MTADNPTRPSKRSKGSTRTDNAEDLSIAAQRYNDGVAALAAELGFPHPVGRLLWIHVDDIQANDYNPNAVAKNEMRLLHTSIEQDGYTQPVVTVWDPDIAKYVIVDGFHRYTVMKTQQDIYDTTGGYLPIVVLDKTVEDRIAATVRHNRARGRHSVQGMSSLVFAMLNEGVEDHEICNRLGLEAEELLRLKHITGFSKLFENVEYQRSWETNRQQEVKAKYRQEHPDEPITI